MAKNIISRFLQIALVIMVLTVAVSSAMQLKSSSDPICEGFPCSSGQVCGGGCFCSGGMCRSAN